MYPPKILPFRAFDSHSPFLVGCLMSSCVYIRLPGDIIQWLKSGLRSRGGGGGMIAIRRWNFPREHTQKHTHTHRHTHILTVIYLCVLLLLWLLAYVPFVYKRSLCVFCVRILLPCHDTKSFFVDLHRHIPRKYPICRRYRVQSVQYGSRCNCGHVRVRTCYDTFSNGDGTRWRYCWNSYNLRELQPAEVVIFVLVCLFLQMLGINTGDTFLHIPLRFLVCLDT